MHTCLARELILYVYVLYEISMYVYKQIKHHQFLHTKHIQLENVLIMLNSTTCTETHQDLHRSLTGVAKLATNYSRTSSSHSLQPKIQPTSYTVENTLLDWSSNTKARLSSTIRYLHPSDSIQYGKVQLLLGTRLARVNVVYNTLNRGHFYCVMLLLLLLSQPDDCYSNTRVEGGNISASCSSPDESDR